MTTLWQDVRFALRLMAKDRTFTALALLVLSLGVGVNCTVFTFVNAVLLRGLPYEGADRLVYIGVRHPGRGLASQVSLPEYADWRSATRSYSELAAYVERSATVSDDREAPERAMVGWVTANTFRLVGPQPLLGRDFAAGEDRRGADPVAILGYGVWQTRYGGDPNVLGRSIRINQVAATVVGVMPQGVRFPMQADLWQPLAPPPAWDTRAARIVNVIGRLRPGVTMAEAQAEATTVARRLERDHPATNTGFNLAVVMTYNERYNGGVIRLVFVSLMGAVGFVLLIACANAANLFLARSASRAREMAVRLAVGATRRRLVRQLLVESVLLGCLAGLVGLGLAAAGVRLFERAIADVPKPYWIEFTFDLPVLAFLAGICVLTGILFGLAPALQVSKTGLNDALKAGGRTAGPGTPRRLTSIIVVTELALTLVLLAGAGLMIRSFFQLYRLDAGFSTGGLIAMDLDLPPGPYAAVHDRLAFRDRLAERLATTPGVESVAFASALPLSPGVRRDLELEGMVAAPDGQWPLVSLVAIDPAYFDVLGIALRHGRPFGERDGEGGSQAAIVSDRFVDRFLPGRDPLGRRLRLRAGEQVGPWLTIVGLVATIRQDGLDAIEPEPVVYVPYRTEAPLAVSVLVRTPLAAAAIGPALRRAVGEIDPDQAVYRLAPMGELLKARYWLQSIFSSLFVIFAVIALALSVVGVYGVAAAAVAERRSEIAIRMALGAQRTHVGWLVLRRGLGQLAIGLVIGLAGALALGRMVRSLLAPIAPDDPLTFTAVSLVLVASVVAACLAPARRAARVDPAILLRAE